MDIPIKKEPPKRKRSHQFLVRMSDQEFEKYQAKLAKSNMTANSYNIKCLIDRPIIQNTLEEVNAMIGIQKSLSGIGNNINQLARVANTDGNLPTVKTLENIKLEVSELWRSLKLLKAEKH